MRVEKIINNGKNILGTVMTPEDSVKTTSGRVDINILLNRARKVKAKETFTNLVFVGLTILLLFVVGLTLTF